MHLFRLVGKVLLLFGCSKGRRMLTIPQNRDGMLRQPLLVHLKSGSLPYTALKLVVPGVKLVVNITMLLVPPSQRHQHSPCEHGYH